MRVRSILKGLMVTTVALGVAAVAMVMTVDVAQYRGLIADQVKAATGRELRIAGTVDLSLSMTPAVVLEDISLANADWGTRPEMLTARRLEAQVDLLPLLRGEIRVQRLVIVGADLLLERDDAHGGNWRLQPPAAEGPALAGAEQAAQHGRSALPDLRQVRLEDARIVLADHATSRGHEVTVAALEATAAGWGAPLAVAGSGTLDKAAFRVEGTVGPLAALLNPGGAPYAIDLSAVVAEASLAVSGSIARPLEAEGFDLAVRLNARDPEKLAALVLPLPPDDLPPLRFDGQVSELPGGWRVDNLAASIGDTAVAGSLTVLLDRPQPAVTGRLSSPRLDLAALLPKPPQPTPSAAVRGRRLVSDAPLPLLLLGLADADLELAVQALRLPEGPELTGVTAAVTLAGGRLSLKPLTVGIGRGTLTVTATVDAARGDAAVVEVEAEARAMQLGRLLAQLGHPGVVEDGPLEGSLRIAGGGGSLRSILAGADGRLQLRIGGGRIDNQALRSGSRDVVLRLGDGLNPLAAREPLTTLHCGVVAVTIRDGIAAADHGLALETAQMLVSGSGTLDLGAEVVDVGFRTTVRDGLGLAPASLSNLLRLRGPLLDPALAVDPAGAARTAASVGGAVATGGLSLMAERLLDQAAGAEARPCARALAPPAAAAPLSAGPTGNPVEDLGSALRGLFGQ
ncbi:AsmA family protein [Caenispirillum bisanense]|uniref:AsmA family protein n=1 Tax=Caenispirillum bisanense TaxID=414052 RepID=UPI0031CFAC7D